MVWVQDSRIRMMHPKRSQRGNPWGFSSSPAIFSCNVWESWPVRWGPALAATRRSRGGRSPCFRGRHQLPRTTERWDAAPPKNEDGISVFPALRHNKATREQVSPHLSWSGRREPVGREGDAQGRGGRDWFGSCSESKWVVCLWQTPLLDPAGLGGLGGCPYPWEGCRLSGQAACYRSLYTKNTNSHGELCQHSFSHIHSLQLLVWLHHHHHHHHWATDSRSTKAAKLKGTHCINKKKKLFSSLSLN